MSVAVSTRGERGERLKLLGNFQETLYFLHHPTITRSNIPNYFKLVKLRVLTLTFKNRASYI